MRRILLLYISNNSGHHRAAKAVEEAIHLQSPDTRVMTLNCFNYTNPVLEKVINSIYNKVIKLKPEVWEYLYDNPKVVRRTRKLRRLIHKFNSKKLEKLIGAFNPHAIACTQAFPCGMVADYKKTLGRNIPLMGILTDYAPHSYWLYDNVDAYVVPNDQTKSRFVANGVPESRVYTFGIPVSQKFQQPADSQSSRAQQLDPDLATVLIMGGGQGLGPIEDLMFALNTIEKEFQMVVVCGGNQKLRRWLESRRRLFRKKMLVLGYSREVEILMDAADILVSKPGGLTTAEALVKGLPIVIVNPIPGQEAKNTEFLLGVGAAVKAKNPLNAAILIEDLLEDLHKRAAMKSACLANARPQAAPHIAQLLLTMTRSG